jgi:hypothetical protein
MNVLFNSETCYKIDQSVCLQRNSTFEYNVLKWLAIMCKVFNF